MAALLEQLWLRERGFPDECPPISKSDLGPNRVGPSAQTRWVERGSTKEFPRETGLCSSELAIEEELH